MTSPFFVYLPDYPDAAARRKEYFSGHITSFTSWVEKGLVKSAGMLVADQPPKEGEEQPGIGSTAVIFADSLVAVRDLVATDPFWINGVWDKEKAVFAPYGSFV